jgi:geranylgeranylglycerol-phosphate geranylgeranyltransferase
MMPADGIKTFRGYWLLARPHNLAIAVPAIFLGGFITSGVHPLLKLILACVSGMWIGAGGNAINDVFDLDIDRINKPRRPLPAGLVTPVEARRFAFACFGLGTVLAAPVNLFCFLIALGSSVLLYLYSGILKRTVFWGNLTVAFMLGLALVYGGLAVGGFRNALIVGLFAFLYNFPREILKDIEDMEGDRAQGAVTLPVRYGIKAALGWATVFLLLLIAATWVPYGLGYFSRTYLWIVAVGVDGFAVFSVVSMWRDRRPASLGRLAVWMKIDMLAGLAAVFFGRIA